MASFSPWGEVQQITEYMRGLASVSTASHGGIRVSKSLCEKYPFLVELNRTSGYGGFSGGYYWFEEDCEYLAPFLVFHEIIYKTDTWLVKNFPSLNDFYTYIVTNCWKYYPAMMEKYYLELKIYQEMA